MPKCMVLVVCLLTVKLLTLSDLPGMTTGKAKISQKKGTESSEVIPKLGDDDIHRVLQHIPGLCLQLYRISKVLSGALSLKKWCEEH